MPSPEEMRELAQGIVASHRSRKQAIGSLKRETRGLMKELAHDSKARRMGVRIQLTGFRNDHQAMGQEVRAELAQAKAQLKSDTAAHMKEVADTTKARKAEVKSQLSDYDSDHQAMGQEVRAELAKVRPESEADNAALMKELGQTTKARKKEVKSQLSGYHSDHQAMGQEVRAELTKARSQLKSDTGALMKGLKAETKATRRAWQEGLKGAPPKPKPRARKKGPVEAAPPKKQAE